MSKNKHEPTTGEVKDADMLTLKQLSRHFFPGTKKGINKWLKRNGLQVKEDGVWIPTNAGVAHCVRAYPYRGELAWSAKFLSRVLLPGPVRLQTDSPLQPPNPM
jgi:hypothetical protein